MTTSAAGQHSRSIVHDNKLTLDLRTRPSRAAVGLTGNDTNQAYDRSGPMLQVKVRLPAGDVTLPCFSVSFSTDDTSGAAGPARDRAPKQFVLNRRFANGADAHAAMESDAKVLGLRQHEIDTAFAHVGERAAIPQNVVLHGFVHDWLSNEVEVNDSDDGKVQAIYYFNIDSVNNPATDKVVHDGVFSLDLTKKPTREALAFLPHYRSATIAPSYFARLRVVVLLGGDQRLATEADTVLSESAVHGRPDTDGVGEPSQTTINRSMSVDAARRQLMEQSSALGLREADVAAAFQGSGRSQKTFVATRTAIYSLEVDVDAQLSQPGDNAAGLTYVFRYR